MNWLAHLFLSEHTIEYQLGNLLADPLKGQLWDGAHEKLQQGVVMHQRIDSFTDQHEDFLLSKSRLRKKGYLKGVVVDLVYDHLLTMYWSSFSRIGLDQFLDEFYRNAMNTVDDYPATAKHFIETLISSNRLQKYANLEDLEEVFYKLDRRLPERVSKKETVSSYMPAVKEQIGEIEEDFLRFFPSLLTYVESSVDRHTLPHWHSFYVTADHAI